jgi:RNA polymerase-binding protein DksA
MKINKNSKASGESKEETLKVTSLNRPEKKGGSTNEQTSSKSKLSEEDIKSFKEILLAKRQQLIGDMDHLTEEALKSRTESAGDISIMPLHMADIGSENYEQEFSLGLMESSKSVVKEIDEALERIKNGTYGICMGTGKLITKARLKLKPWAKYSMEYLRKNEEKHQPLRQIDE